MPEIIDVMNAVQGLSDRVKNQAEDAAKQIAKQGELSNSLRAAVDQALTAQGELQAQIVDLQQRTAEALSTIANGTPEKAKSLGEQFLADEAVQAFIASPMTASSSVGKRMKNVSVSSGSTSAGPLVTPTERAGIIGLPTQQLRVRDLLTWGRTVSNAIEFFRELSFTNNAAPVSELVTKPESGITFESATANVVTVAHWIKASRQILADAPMLQSYINTRLQYGLKLKEEGQLLNGSGVGQNLQGLRTAATAYSAPAGVTVSSENRMDRLRLAILQAELTGYTADGIVLSLQDWTAIELSKTASDKQYLVGNPFGQLTPTLWARPVVASSSMSALNWLVGAFGVASQGWDREDISVQLNFTGDDFIKNAITILVEERLALTNYVPGAMIKGTFTSGM